MFVFILCYGYGSISSSLLIGRLIVSLEYKSMYWKFVGEWLSDGIKKYDEEWKRSSTRSQFGINKSKNK